MKAANTPPLRLHILFHPDSKASAALAAGVYAGFTRSAATPGLRIPVLYGPSRPHGAPPKLDELDLGAAAHSLVIVLVDERMSRRGEAGSAAAWGGLLKGLLAWAPPRRGPHAVLPVAVDERAFELDGSLAHTSFVRVDLMESAGRVHELEFQIAVRALYLLLRGSLPIDAQVPAPVTLFISHAKRDLPRDPSSAAGPVRALLAQLAQGPVDHWYDAKEIPPGGRFDDEIRTGILESSAMICVVTDDYSAREWCRREVLEAKGAGRPILIVDALSGEVPRAFPYLGNAPTVRWTSDADAPRVIALAVREALRYRYGVEVLRAGVESGEVVFGTAPEILTVTALRPGTRRVLYPDPPLGREELEPLLRAAGAVEFVTPLSRLACRPRPAPNDGIGLSLSNSPDAAGYGASPEHLLTFSEDVCLFLLLAGYRLAYGGVIGHEGAGPNYVEALIGVALSHSPLAERIGVDFKPIVNYVSWPIHRRLGDDERAVYGRAADLVELPQPADLGFDAAQLEPDAVGFFPSDAADTNLAARRRYAWARSLTAMRERMTHDLAARVAMGGKLAGFAGIVPGVLEEALLSLRARRPLYLAGAFGGAARLAVDAIEGRARPELSADVSRASVPHYDEVRALYSRAGVAMYEPGALGEEFAALGRGGPAAALSNGLDDSENRELFASTDALRLVELVLLGLARLSEGTRD